MDILRIENLSKSFGKTKVINNISLAVPKGSVFGFIGVNGAGKTTTMKMILGLLKPDNGDIFLYDEKVQFGMTKTNRFVGYLPDVPEFYHYMRPKEYLRLCGQIVGLPGEVIKRRSAKLLELVGLAKANKKIGSFSRGMKQRLGVAQALINEPKLLICDEPTSALDPIGRKEILAILRQIHEETTVIFSTHILSDVERICDRAAVLHGGKIVMEGTLAELKTHHKADGLRIEFLSAADKKRFCEKAPKEWKSNEHYREVTGTGEEMSSHRVSGSTEVMNYSAGLAPSDIELTLHVQDVSAAERKILQILSQNDILPSRIERLEPSIENLFLEAVT